MVSRDCCVALPSGAIGLSVVCDYGISLSYSLIIINHQNIDIHHTKKQAENILSSCSYRIFFMKVIFACKYKTFGFIGLFRYLFGDPPPNVHVASQST